MRWPRRSWLGLALVSLGGLGASVSAQPGVARDTLAAEAVVPPELRERTFRVAWETVRDRVYDPALAGARWDSVRTAFAPRVGAAETNELFHLLLSEMVAELERSHFVVDPPHRAGRFEDQGAPRGALDATTGLGFDVVEGDVAVVEIAMGSSAEAAGVRVGDVVQAVDGRGLGALLDTHLRLLPAVGHMGATFRTVRAVGQGLVGEAGEAVRLTLDTADGRRDVEVVRAAEPVSTAVTWRRVGDVGVVRLPLFFHRTAVEFDAALDSLSDVRGLVIDLRGTPGGLGSILPALAGHLHRESGTLGTVRQRQPGTSQVTRHPFHFHGRPDAYAGPVAVLVDGTTASSAEVLAAGLQATGRAVVVGRRTVGAVLPMGQVALPSGGMLRLPVAEIRPPDERVIEGAGVEPDVVVRRTIEGLRAGRDEVLEAALAWIRKAGRSPEAGSTP